MSNDFSKFDNTYPDWFCEWAFIMGSLPITLILLVLYDSLQNGKIKCKNFVILIQGGTSKLVVWNKNLNSLCNF